MSDFIVEHGSDDLNARYALVDSDGNVVNVIVWDGVSPYNPGDFTIVALANIKNAVAPGDDMAPKTVDSNTVDPVLPDDSTP
ncbi:MAG TPA: hypothetical protein VHC63_13365 [Acidimicrobiales bacterium]|nr:hypothetical protein [Acidimicrobiales bacterium]